MIFRYCQQPLHYRTKNMLKHLVLKNFKRFTNQKISLNHLTLLSGLNGTGKSSVLQALLLLRQSLQQNNLSGLALNGDLVQIGTAKDALNVNATQDELGFEIGFNDKKPIAWNFKYDTQTDVLARISPTPDIQSLIEYYQQHFNLFTDDFQYLQAERLGPRRFLEISDFQVRQHRQLGTQGEYTAHFLALFGDSDKIADRALAHPQQNDLNLKLQVEAWLSEISPGSRISTRSNPDMDLVSLQYSFAGGSPFRATNVGFGITYTLPVIVAILSAQPGALLLLENPEAHLHPRGQAQMGELMARAASIGIQIIVETHSDHILNGMRLSVHRGTLQPQDLTLHFFLPDRDPPESLLVSPKIDRTGKLDQWPSGFFDEWDKSLDELLEPPGV
jgi:predicted ATPase